MQTETMCFPIRVAKDSTLLTNGHDLKFESQNNECLILATRFCTEREVRGLWAQKNRLTAVFDTGREGKYYHVREQVFPDDHRGSKR
jgi:hypothetical protein